MDDDYLGTLVPADWTACPTAAVLAPTEFARGYFEPVKRPTFDARIGVAFQPFRWDETAPWTWLLCTVGLSVLTQQRERHRVPIDEKKIAKASPHIELCAAVREPSGGGWAPFREAWQAGTLPTFGGVPSVLPRFALVAQDFASWIARDGEMFAIGDHVQNASLAGGFPSALLIPPIPELLFSGLAPFDAQSTRADIHLSEWTDHERLHSSGDHLFVQLAPLTAEEYEVARWDGLRFFANALLASDEDLARGLDASTHIIDMTRGSRCEFF